MIEPGLINEDTICKSGVARNRVRLLTKEILKVGKYEDGLFLTMRFRIDVRIHIQHIQL